MTEETKFNSFSNHHQLANDLNLPPAQTLLQALQISCNTGKEKSAVDLGCGAGTDAIYLLKNGWNVHAIDKEQPTLDNLKLKWPYPTLTISQQTFEDLKLDKAYLINCSFALPFCQPQYFDHCWRQVTDALEPRGIFCGHFFGERDSWAMRQDMTFHSLAALKRLFRDFEIKWQQETEKDGKTLGGEPKHWHVHHIVACKG